MTSRTNANVGDLVMVGPGGSATVVYDDGCKVNVQPGAVTTIAPLSPCASGSNAQQWPWECPPYDPAHPEQTGGCGWQTTAFWLAFLGMGAFIGYEISQISGPATGQPCKSIRAAIAARQHCCRELPQLGRCCIKHSDRGAGASLNFTPV